MSFGEERFGQPPKLLKSLSTRCQLTGTKCARTTPARGPYPWLLTDFRFHVPTRSTEPSPADPEPTVASGWPTGADQVQKAQKPPKTRNATAERARLPVTAKCYRKPKKIPQFFPRAAGSGGLKMRMGNHPLQVSRSHWEATGTKFACRSQWV